MHGARQGGQHTVYRFLTQFRLLICGNCSHAFHETDSTDTERLDREKVSLHSVIANGMELGAKINLLPSVAFGGLFYHSNRNGANLTYKAEEYRAQPDGMAVAAVKIMEPLSHAAAEPAGTSVRASCRNTGRRINGFQRGGRRRLWEQGPRSKRQVFKFN